MDPYLHRIRLTLPWNLGNVTSSAYTTYQWTPDPYISTVVVVLMFILTLIPLFCSLCYHIFDRKNYLKQVILIHHKDKSKKKGGGLANLCGLFRYSEPLKFGFVVLLLG